MKKIPVLRQLIPEARVIVDAGVGPGGDTRALLSAFPDAEVHGFEPGPEYVHDLENLDQQKPRFHYVKAALADRTEQAWFNLSSRPANHSMLPYSEIHKREWPHRMVETVAVPCWALDDYCQEADVHWVDILHLDLQGGELIALRGARRMLEEQRIGAVIAELDYYHYYEGQAWHWQVCAFLHGFGYRLRFSFPSWGNLLTYADGVFLAGEVADKHFVGLESADDWEAL